MPVIPILTTLLPLATLLIATIARFAVRIFMKVFDWSTEIFFGRISSDKSRKLTVLSALSMIWIITLICIPFPDVAKVTLAFLPSIVRTNKLVVYLLNGAGVLFIPISVGIICIFWDMQINIQIMNTHNIKKLQYKQALMGFYYTFYLGLSFITMFVFSPIIKLTIFIKKRKILLTPATIQKGRYEIVLKKIQKVLRKYDINTQLCNVKIMYNIPITLIGHLSESLFKNLIVKNKRYLYSKELEIYIHYEDIMIKGKEEYVKKTRAILSEELMFDTTYLTWDEETKKLEDILLNIYSDFIISGGTRASQCIQRIENIKDYMEKLVVDYDDLETVKCQMLKLENIILKWKIENKFNVVLNKSQ